MMSIFKRFSVATQALILLLLMLAGTTSALYFWATDNAMQSELSHTRTVADMADAYRAQASHFGGFYLRRPSLSEVESVGRFLASFDSEAKQPDGSLIKYTFHQKNPFLALIDYSAEVQKSPAAAKFRMVSDNYMNPVNRPDGFEMRALAALRDTKQSEYWDIVGGQLRFARALTAAPACLACHGAPEAAPAVVTIQYRPPAGKTVGGGYGYVVGQTVGLTSVTIKHQTPRQMLGAQGFGFWLSAASVVLLMTGAYFAVVHGLVTPLRRLSRYAHEIADSDDPRTVRAPVFDRSEGTSSSEIHMQSHALKRLHASMLAAFNHIMGMRK